jgi:serine/threonine protein phosphatase PrpC
MAGIIRGFSAPLAPTKNPWQEDSSTNALQRSFTIHHPEDLESFPTVEGNTEKRMRENRDRAAWDHGIDPGKLPESAPKRPTHPLNLLLDTSSNLGPRESNDDEHVVFETDYGPFFAICDGHGDVLKERLRKNEPQPGRVFAQIVAKSIKEDLPGIMKENLDVKVAFEIWAHQIHEKLPKDVNAGSTVVVGFFDKITHKLYVANIGDSEAVVFREDDTLLYPYPMTPKNNWETPVNEDRVKALYKPEDFLEFKKLSAKYRRFPLKSGVNISNTLGDHTKTIDGKTALTHTPDCTVLQLKAGDLVLLGCDGLFDYVDTDEMIDKLLQKHWNDLDVNLAELIAQYALKEKGSKDNVTVMTLRVQPATHNVEIKRAISTASCSLETEKE